jgi:hypothetical protein
MRFHHLAFALAAFTVLTLNGARADVLVNVDKATQRMTVTVDGAPLYTWKVSTGIADYDTPDGEFQAFRMDRHHFSKEWDDAPMPYSIFFTQQGHAIHGTNEVRHLGRAASHGCVRLSKEHAAILFDLVKEQGLKATRVVLTGDIPDSAGGAVARREPPLTYDNADTGSIPRRGRSTRNLGGWHETQNGPRYYFYRDQPYAASRYYRDESYATPPPRRYGFGRQGYPYGW